VVIGWLGSETTAPYLNLVDDALARVSKESDVIVRVVGGAYANPGVRRLEVKGFALEREQTDLEGFDIGILPEPDDPWTRGKGGYKALLYMAVGIPVVASRVGVNTDIVSEAETGFCVSTTEEWVAALRRLVADPTLRERMGAAGRARVIDRYSIQVIAPRLAKALTAPVRGVA
jgi:glycosyltransferase involved in cell wall biosynthesis